MKKKYIYLAIAAVLVVAGFIFSAVRSQARFIENNDSQVVAEALELLRNSLPNYRPTYIDFLRGNTAPHGTGIHTALPRLTSDGAETDSLQLSFGNSAYYIINVPQTGLFQLNLEYFVDIHTHSQSFMRMQINGETQFVEMESLALRMLFYDESKDFPTNAFGDQSPPMTRRRIEWQQDYLFDALFTTASPLLFRLEAGDNIISLTNMAQVTHVGALTAGPAVPLPTYAEYRAGLPGVTPAAHHTILINATDYIGKNSADIMLYSSNSVRAYPIHHDMRLLNSVWMYDAGATVTYGFYAPANGLYAIGMNIWLPWVDLESYITIRINGEIPFEEFRNFSLRGNERFNDFNFQSIYNRETGEHFFVYLTAGYHTLCITLESEPVSEIINNLRLVVDHTAQFNLQTRMITGTGTIDATRSWNFTRYIPETVAYLEAYEAILRDVIYTLQFRSDAGVNSELLAEAVVIFNTLERLLEFPDDFPLHLSSLVGRNSIQDIAGRLFAGVTRINMGVESIVLSTDPTAIEGLDANWLDALVHEVRSVAVTFTSPRFNHRFDEEIVNVWVAQRSISELDVLQNLTDTHFTPYSGIQVRFSIMPDVNRLIMSAAANETPDMAIGLPSWMAFDLASRNALHDLTQFQDFWQVAGQFPPGSLVPFAYIDGMYALPESLEFNILAYRVDILEALDIPVPNTWQDVTDILPELQRYGMNFFHPMSNPHALKFLHQTWPMFLQHDVGMFTTDGSRTLINDPAGVAALSMLGDFFVRHAMPMEIPSAFDAFRHGITPVAIIGSGQYRAIRFGARELQGQWNIAPLPGIEQPDGSISRWYVANGQSAIMYRDSGHKDAAWEWLTWWLSAQTQAMYAQFLTSSFGEFFFWIPSNKDAWDAINLPHEHREIVMEQLMWLQDAQRIPGLYMVEREISNAWNAIVLEGMSPQRAADRAATRINREVRRKMIEFGFLDADGNQLREFILRDIYWIIENIERAAGQ